MSQPTVLIVTAEADLAHDAKKHLEQHTFSVVAVKTAHDALERIRAGDISVALVDADLPDASGLDLLNQVREAGLETEAVVWCASGALDASARAIELGAYDILVKPVFDESLTLLAVRKAHERRELIGDRARLVSFLEDKVGELETKNSELDESVERIQAIEALGRELSLIQHAERVQHAVVDALSQQLGARRVCLLLLDDEREELRIAASRGIEAKTVRQTVIPLGTGARQRGAQTTTSFDDIDAGDVFLSEERFSNGTYISTPNRLEVPLSRGTTLYGVVSARDATRAFRPKDLEFINILASQAATALENLAILLDMKQSYIEVIYSLVNAIEMKDAYTSGHSRRVTRYTKAIARQMALTRIETEIISNGALLHDVGKIGMRANVINHPGRLSEIEFQEFRKHPTLGRTILMPGRVFRDLIPMVYFHHERADGRGYPTGIAGEEIPLGARIVTCADAFDAMTSNRAYRQAMPKNRAIEELKRCAGSQFDKEVVEVFVDALSSGKIEAFDQSSGVGTTPDARPATPGAPVVPPVGGPTSES